MTEHLRRITGRGVMLVIFAIGILAYSVQTLLMPFIVAGVLAFICTPLVNWIASKAAVWRALAAAVVFTAVVATIGAAGYLAVPRVWSEMLKVITNFEEIVHAAIANTIGSQPVTILGQTMSADEMTQQAVDVARSWLIRPERFLTIAGLSFASFIASVLTIVLFGYMLFDGPRIERGLIWLVPPPQRPFAHHLWGRLEPALRRYFVGLAVVVLYTSLASYVGLALFLGLPHAVFLAVLTGFLELIPIVGPFASAVLAGVIALQGAQGIGGIIAYAAYATALRLSIDQIVGPVVLGSAARIHPALVIFCLLVGGYLFGIAGVILAVPVALTIKIVLATLYNE